MNIRTLNFLATLLLASTTAIDEFYPDGGYGDLEYDSSTGRFVYLSYRGKGLHGEAEIVQYRFRLKGQQE